MSGKGGHIELDMAIDAIQVGHRHRKDVGDLTELCASIERLGLLQPITITPGRVLLCGARRLAAVKHLSWRTVKVWVRSGISGRMELLMAEQHENTMRAPLTPTEAADLYRELKTVMAEDAARRQQATRFSAENDTHTDESAGHDGGATVAPSPDGKTRAQAAQLVTGRNSYTTLERVGELQTLTEDDDTPEHIRELAHEALTAMARHGEVKGPYAEVKAAQAIQQLEQLANDPDVPTSMREQAAREAERLHAQDDLSATELLQATKQALDRANTANPCPSEPPRRRARKRGPRAFLVMWSELRGWTEEYDPIEIGHGLTDEQWTDFETTINATLTFTEVARQARVDARSSPAA